MLGVCRSGRFRILLSALAVAMLGGQALAQDFAGTRALDIPDRPGIVNPFKQTAKAVYSKEHVVVGFYSNSTPAVRELAARQVGLSLRPGQDPTRHMILDITSASKRMGLTVESAVLALLRNPAIRYAEFDVLLEPEYIPNDPRFNELWGLHNTGQSAGTVDADIDGPEAWDIVLNHPEVVVAVCDDGFDYNHPDLANAMWQNPGEIPGNGIDDDGNGFIDDIRGYDFSDNDANVLPASGDSHGTHVAGTVGASFDNGVGVAGVGPNVRVMGLRMFGGATAWMTALANAIDYAWENGAAVISVSYNIDGFTQAMSDAVGRAKAADVVYCNSAGNNGQQNPARQALRATHNNVLLVASSTRTDTKSSFSNYGTLVEVAAPGSDILSTTPNNTYSVFSGTSMACPHAASAIAVVRSMNPGLSARGAIDLMLGTADKPAGLLSTVPGGRINLNNALEIDTVPPADIANLTIIKRGITAAGFRMTASGDDGMSGVASSYEVAISASPLNNGNFNAAQALPTIYSDTPAGTDFNFVANGIEPGLSLYLGVRAVDNLGNRSNVKSFGPFATNPAVITDNVEGTSIFSSSSTWAVTTSRSFSPTKSWTDSPSGNYANNANVVMTQTTPVVVTGPVALTFMLSMDIEQNDDFLRLEASINGGAFTEVKNWTGTATAWKKESAAVNANNGDSVQFRFRLTSDGTTTRDGAYLDDFKIVSMEQVLNDDMEGSSNFTPQSPWALTTENAFSPTRAWSDSPGGNYVNNLNTWLRGSVDYDLRSIINPVMTFMTNYNLETNFDFVNVMTSADSGATYNNIGVLNGTTNLTWQGRSYAMPNEDFARVAFQLTTDGSVVRDGIYLDNLAIFGEPCEPVVAFPGWVGLNNFLGNISSRPLNVDVLNAGTNTVAANFTVNPTVAGSVATGTYMFITDTVGTFDVRVKCDGYLAKRVNGVVIAQNMGQVSHILTPGDADGDNAVTGSDLIITRLALGSTPGSPRWDARADINGDLVVDFRDVRAVSLNMGAVGD